MMLDNSTFNKVKLLYKLSELLWFIEKHALVDANNAGDQQSISILNDLQKDLQKQVANFQKSLCTISQ